ncbi:type II toxin-antitoxin system prevent-host-death family antitoxin [Egibacter rhizosphaerae]|uniref:Type II toxin-antitoxin system prevent-host-death family antitoxin n=1 Tax=Egibacter rhizosphaerae TaxID=1670831 RepID=A0A411YIF8_9ACTN|nr:type II toxin-antitoxin system prevent-host-death family antitoxin [Egibacter rhizosphaerae]QBI21095.1 type II toxin-antitoxin system prevent-host-death family antitoxin [Egibacter rhizosphaerae]
MPDVSATEAARQFASLLDAVEQQGEHYTIVRRGKAVAHLEPVGRGRGDQVKAALVRHDPDPSWAQDLDDIRALLSVEERR